MARPREPPESYYSSGPRAVGALAVWPPGAKQVLVTAG